ncbi:MAG: dihydrolipoyl dehydrogenase [Bacteroidales bacterium]|nr:dihydrolipoyl dehydrogenase [Bacteroidales bacterium]
MYDLAIIGGGPAGYTAAERAAAGGLNTILFEKANLGGTCLNEGCIPTKALLYSSKLYHYAQTGAKYGVGADNVRFEYDKIVARKNKIVRKLNAGIRSKMKENNVTVITGFATVASATEEVVTIACNGETYEAKTMILAAGSETTIPPIKGVDTAEFWTSREALEAKEVPASIAIIGGGVIGMEFAGLFNQFGSQVTVIEMAPEILPPIDAEIAAMLRQNYEKQGVKFYIGAKVMEVKTGAVVFETADGEQTLETEKTLLCVGRRPALKELGLEALNLERFRNGIAVDAQMRTSMKNIFAVGDVTAFSMLAHTATREAEVAVNTLLGKDDAMSYKAIPGVVYTYPEIAGTGKTEQELQREGTAYKVLKLPMTFSGRFVVENEGGNGLCKIITNEAGAIIGAHMIGNPSSELITIASLAIEAGWDVERLKTLVFPHPSVSEIFKETLFA